MPPLDVREIKIFHDIPFWFTRCLFGLFRVVVSSNYWQEIHPCVKHTVKLQISMSWLLYFCTTKMTCKSRHLESGEAHTATLIFVMTIPLSFIISTINTNDVVYRWYGSVCAFEIIGAAKPR